MYKAHWIHPDKGLLRVDQIDFRPSVGDEARINDHLSYKIKRVVWCLDDESDEDLTRVNVEVETVRYD